VDGARLLGEVLGPGLFDGRGGLRLNYPQCVKRWTGLELTGASSKEMGDGFVSIVPLSLSRVETNLIRLLAQHHDDMSDTIRVDVLPGDTLTEPELRQTLDRFKR
jgi:hypothetical protein